MSKANRFGTYKCSHGKRIMRVRNSDNDVTGRFCKNNCGRYMKNCNVFKR